jgi:two-component system response regulator HydG
MGLVILIVEDDPAMGELLEKVLARRGYDILLAESASEALLIFKNHRIDLVLSDLSMPKIDGFKLLGQLKDIQPNLPVILMTSFGDQQQGIRALQEGACHLLSKPVNMETLLDCVETLLPTPESSATTSIT